MVADRQRPDLPRDDQPSEEELAALARQGRHDLSSTDVDHVLGLWDGIAAAAFGDESTSEDAPARSAGDRPDTAVGDLVTTRRRTRRPLRLGLGLAAALLVLVAVGAGVAGLLDRTTTVATFELQPLDVGQNLRATNGQVVERAGHHAVEVDLDALPTLDDGFYELWLLDAETGALISLGPVSPDRRYAVPAGHDLGSLPLVDVSIEPFDGDPTHSGNSVLRGDLRT